MKTLKRTIFLQSAPSVLLIYLKNDSSAPEESSQDDTDGGITHGLDEHLPSSGEYSVGVQRSGESERSKTREMSGGRERRLQVGYE